MKKIINLIAITLLFMLLFIGCGIKENTSDGGNTINNGKVSDVDSNSIFSAEIIETGASLLIAPKEESNEYRSSDKISVSLNDTKLMNSDGKEITKESLNVGDIIEVTYNGVILESYPAQITALTIKLVDNNILSEGN